LKRNGFCRAGQIHYHAQPLNKGLAHQDFCPSRPNAQIFGAWKKSLALASCSILMMDLPIICEPLCLAPASSRMCGATETERKLVYMIEHFDDDDGC
jgi:hypothetical protein